KIVTGTITNTIRDASRSKSKKQYSTQLPHFLLALLSSRIAMSLQIPILFKQVFKFILYNNIVWLVELARQCVHSHTEQLANRFQEGRAKNLPPLRITLVADTFFQNMVSKLENQQLWPIVGFKRSKSADTSVVLTFSFYTPVPHIRRGLLGTVMAQPSNSPA